MSLATLLDNFHQTMALCKSRNYLLTKTKLQDTVQGAAKEAALFFASF